MNMNFNQLAALQKAKEAVDRFRKNHPKFPPFLEAVGRHALKDGTLIEISVTTPDGTKYESNLQLNSEDMELMEMLTSMSKMV